MSKLTDFNISANDACSNVYLIDENLCLGDSYQIMNANFSGLSSSLLNLETYANDFYNIYTTFTVNSAKILKAFDNIHTLSASWNSAYSTVESTSSYWQTPLEIIYPKLIVMDDWYSYTNNYETVVIKNWLDYVFPPTDFYMNQKLVVCINLFKNVNFDFKFQRSYYESCYIYSSRGISCGRCNIGQVKCNHPDADGKKDIPSCNLCNNCDVRGESKSGSVTCRSLGGQTTLNLNYSRYMSDGFIPRNIKVEYININNVWTLI